MSAITPVPAGQLAASRPDRPCRLLDYKPQEGNSALAARCSVAFAGGWCVANIPIFRTSEGGISVGTPSTPILTADGSHARGADGKKRYQSIVTFETKDARERWQRLVLAALADAGIIIAR